MPSGTARPEAGRPCTEPSRSRAHLWGSLCTALDGTASIRARTPPRMTDPFPLEVAGVTPTAQDVGPPLHTDWLLVV
jgi:hypothetical protein